MNKKQAIKLLKGAKKIIEMDTHYYVCLALESAYLDNLDIDYVTYTKVSGWIANSLKPNNTVNSWLVKNYEKAYNTIIDADGNLKQYKIAWIDEMIKQVKNGEMK